VCPLGLSNISKALQTMGRDREQFVPIFVTIDPTRDTMELLALYSTNFDPSFIYLGGAEAAVSAVTKQYRVYAKKEPAATGAPKDSYLVNHSSYIYLLDRAGHFIKQIPHDMSAHEMHDTMLGLLIKTKKNA
jgi:protein SCO1/2